MLITCPECELQVSDKALACPHCGYPLKTNFQKSPSGNSRPRKYKRLPNGFGQITELKNRNLRNRFRVMVSIGKTEYGKPIQKMLKPQAYFPTYKDAYEALLEYHKRPFEVDPDMTVKELYEKWSEQYTGVLKSHAAAWQYCSEISDIRVTELRPRHIKFCIENGSRIKNGKEISIAPTVKPRIKQLFNLMLDYAIENDIVDRNYSRMFKLSNDIIDSIDENEEHHIVFLDEELELLKQNINLPIVDVILFQCYSGWRPQEVCLLKVKDIHLDKHYMIGGIKTKAGRQRIVPIHPKNEAFVQKYLTLAEEIGSEWFINVPNKKGKAPWIPLKYDRYYKDFKSVVRELDLNPNHKPHDPRKQFITMAKQNEVDEYAIKRIVGHAIVDITESTYTDRSINWLYDEICKIP